MAPFHAATRGILLGILLPLPSVAQDAYRGTLQVRSSDRTPLAVSIDNRRYNHVGRQLLIGDLPTGRHRLRVYAVYPNRNDAGAAGETVYQGVFYAEPGTVTECVVDAGRGTAQLHAVDATPRYSTGRGGANVEPPPRSANGTPYSGNPGSVSLDLDALRQRVEAHVGDGEKLQTLKADLEHQTVRTDAVRTMLGWLAFDTTRLEFAKWIYPHTEDRTTFPTLKDAFSFDGTKTEFDTYLRNAR